MPEYSRRSTIPAAPDEVFAWHARDGAFERLVPPWQDVRVLERAPGLDEGTRVVLAVRVGPVSWRWIARHEDVDPGRGFRDVQVSGPFAEWQHAHRFEPGPGGTTVLEDEIRYRLPGGALGSALAGARIAEDLERAFAFRHQRTAADLARLAHFAGRPPLTVAVSGARGLVGTQLAAFLRAGGHRVVPIVRRAAGPAEIAYDPVAGTIADGALAGVDAIVHLGGEGIAEGRWTAARKAAIRASRVRSTELLASAAARVDPRPKVFVCASAIGWYDPALPGEQDESAPSGPGFLAEVCRAWEGATRPAADAGIRVVNVRIGIVLSARGGALGRMLLPFRMGLGGRVGDGRQEMSWIAIDDLVGVLHHALHDETLEGPVNATAPRPANNADFTSTLARVLARPAILPVPGTALRLILGEMADALVLRGARVVPAKLASAGFRFVAGDLEQALRAELGRIS